MTGLHRVICIDSHITGRHTELVLNEDMLLRGDNGVGKTSQLKLVAFFYGAEPAKLEEQAAGKKSFVEYYYPRETSYVIYEYERSNGEIKTLATFADTSGKQIRFIWIDGAFNPEFFFIKSSDETSRPVLNKDFKRHLENCRVTYSSEVGTYIEYRTIMQNDRQALAGRGRSISQIAARYSLCDSGRHMRGIENVVLATLTKVLSMRAFRQLIADLLRSEQLQLDEQNLSREHVTTLATDIKILRELGQHATLFDAIDTKILIVHDATAKLATLGFQLRLEQTTSVGKKEQAEAAMLNLESSKTLLDQEFHQECQKLASQKIQGEAKVADTEGELDRLDRQQDEHDKADMITVGRNIESIPSWMDDLEVKRTRHRDLLKGKEEIINAQSNAESEARKRADRDRDNTRRNEKAAIAALSQAEQEWATRRNELVSEKEVQIRSVADEYSQILTSISDEITDTTKTLKYAQETPEEKHQLKAAQSALDEANRVLQDVHKALRLEEQKVVQVRAAQTSANMKYQKSVATLESERKRLAEFDEKIKPAPGTLHEYLASDTEEIWLTNVAKVLDPTLLDRKDLHPDMALEGRGVFGLELDLSKIDTPIWAAEDTVKKTERDRHVAAVEAAEETKGAYEKELQATTFRVEEAVNEAQVVSNRTTDAESRVTALIDARTELELQIKESASRRRLELQNLLTALQQRLKKVEDQRATVLKEAEERKTAALLDLSAMESQVINPLRQDRDRLEKQYKEIDDRRDKEIQNIKRQFEEALSAKGINQKTLSMLQSDIGELEQKIADARGKLTAYEIYKIWKAGEPEKRRRLAAQKAEGEMMRQQAVAALATLSAHHQSAQYRLNSELQERRGQLAHLNDNITNTTRILKEIPELTNEHLEPGALDPSLTAVSAMTSFAQSEVSRLRRTKEELKIAVAEFEGLIAYRAKGHQLQTRWRQFAEGIDDELKKAPMIRTFRQGAIKQIEDIVRVEIRRIGMDLQNHRYRLSEVETGIRRKASQINEQIADHSEFPNITNLRLELNCTLSREAFWSSLNAFTHAFEVWDEAGGIELPEDQMLADLVATSNYMAYGTAALKLENLFEAKLIFEENGRPVTIDNKTEQLSVSSSNGLSYIVQCQVLLAVVKLLRRDERVHIHWVIDEAAMLDPSNIGRLLKVFSRNNVRVIAAMPIPDPSVMAKFKLATKLTRQGYQHIERIPRAIDRLKGGAAHD